MPDPKDRTIFETIEVAGSDLVDRVKALLKDGNVRRIRLTTESGDLSLELPMTIGVLAGGALVLAAPVLAVLGVIAAMVARVKIEVERTTDPDQPPAPPDRDKP